MPTNITVPVLTSVSISKSSYTSDVLEIARSYLEGCYQDYYFFQYDTYAYVLLVGDLTLYQGSVSSDSCIVFYIVRDVQSTSRTEYLHFDGDQQGTYGGTDGTGTFHGIENGQVALDLTTTSYSYFVRSAVADSSSFVLVQNPDSRLVYSSFDDYPHLIEGVQNYAFAAFALCSGILVYKLADRLFRRVY